VIGKARKYCAPRSVAYPLQVLDFWVDQYARGAYAKRNFGSVDQDRPKILVMTSGHLGDALIFSYAFPLIRQRYPDAIIDLVAGDWCDPILKGNPYIRRLIHLNHAGTNRRKISTLDKWRDHSRTMREAIRVLRTETYDYSLDIRFSDSPMHFLLPFIQVRHSIGFGSRGWGGLLDTELFLPDGEFHHFDLILRMLEYMDVKATMRSVTPYFAYPPVADKQALQKLELTEMHPPLALLFPETGEPKRTLPVAFWVELASRLLRETDYFLVGCGQTPFTSEVLEKLKENFPAEQHRIINAVGKLNLAELAALSKQARIAFTLESLPAHLGSIFCQTVSFYFNGTGLQFFPIANFPVLVVHDHLLSRSLTLDRPGFESIYVEQFDQKTLDWAMQRAHEQPLKQ